MAAMKNKIPRGFHGIPPMKLIGYMFGINTRNKSRRDPNKLYLEVETAGSSKVLIRSLELNKNATVKDLYESIHQKLQDKKAFDLFKGYSTNKINNETKTKKVKDILGSNRLVTLLVRSKLKLYIGNPNDPYFTELNGNSFRMDTNFGKTDIEYGNNENNNSNNNSNNYGGYQNGSSLSLSFIVLIINGSNNILLTGVREEIWSGGGEYYDDLLFRVNWINNDFADRLKAHMNEFNGTFEYEDDVATEKYTLTLDGHKFILEDRSDTGIHYFINFIDQQYL